MLLELPQGIPYHSATMNFDSLGSTNPPRNRQQPAKPAIPSAPHTVWSGYSESHHEQLLECGGAAYAAVHPLSSRLEELFWHLKSLGSERERFEVLTQRLHAQSAELTEAQSTILASHALASSMYRDLQSLLPRIQSEAMRSHCAITGLADDLGLFYLDRRGINWSLPITPSEKSIQVLRAECTFLELLTREIDEEITARHFAHSPPVSRRVAHNRPFTSELATEPLRQYADRLTLMRGNLAHLRDSADAAGTVFTNMVNARRAAYLASEEIQHIERRIAATTDETGSSEKRILDLGHTCEKFWQWCDKTLRYTSASLSKKLLHIHSQISQSVSGERTAMEEIATTLWAWSTAERSAVSQTNIPVLQGHLDEVTRAISWLDITFDLHILPSVPEARLANTTLPPSGLPVLADVWEHTPAGTSLVRVPVEPAISEATDREHTVHLSEECFETVSIDHIDTAMLSRLGTLQDACWSSPWSVEHFRDILGLTTPVFITLALSASGALVGASVTAVRSDTLVILDLAVHPEYRRSGVGARLLEEELQRCSSKQVFKVLCLVHDTNVAGQFFLRSRSFQAFGQWTSEKYGQFWAMGREVAPDT